MIMAQPLMFIDSAAALPKSSIRDRELQQALARSHAASVSHRARKLKQKQQKQQQDATKDTTGALVAYTAIHSESGQSSPRGSNCLTNDDYRHRQGSFISNLLDSSRLEEDNVQTSHHIRRDASRSMLEEMQYSSIYGDCLGYRINPFIRLRQHDISPLYAAIDYYQDALLPMMTIDHIFNATTVIGQYMLRLLMHEKLRFSAIAAIFVRQHNHESPRGKLPPNTLHYIDKALVNHRQRLESGKTDEYTVSAAMQHTIIAETMGDTSSYKTHQSIIKPLLDSIHKVKAPENILKFALIQAQSALSIGSGSPVPFNFPYTKHSDSYYPAPPFALGMADMISKLPRGFQTLAARGMLASDVIAVLARTTNTAAGRRADQKINSIEQHHPFEFVQRRYADYFEACPCLGRPDGQDGRPDLEKLIILALILYCFHVFSPHPSITISYDVIRKRLTADVPRRTPYPIDEKDVMRWIWVNIIDAWRSTTGALTPTGLDLLQKLRLQGLCLDSEQERQDFFARFFSTTAFLERWSSYLQPSKIP